MNAVTQIVGWTSIGLTCFLGVVTLAISIYLIVKVRRLPALTAFLPISAAPAIIGFSQTSLSLIREISTSLETGVEDTDLVLLLALCGMPTVFGFLASLPAVLVTSIGLFVQTLRIPQTAAVATTANSNPRQRRTAKLRQTVDTDRGNVTVQEVSYLTLDSPDSIDY